MNIIEYQRNNETENVIACSFVVQLKLIS